MDNGSIIAIAVLAWSALAISAASFVCCIIWLITPQMIHLSGQHRLRQGAATEKYVMQEVVMRPHKLLSLWTFYLYCINAMVIIHQMIDQDQGCMAFLFELTQQTWETHMLT